MDNAELDSVLRTAAGNIRQYAKRSNAPSLDKADQIIGLTEQAARQLNDEGKIDKIPQQVRHHFIAETVQNVAIDALNADKVPDAKTLHDALKAEIESSKAVQLAEQRAAQMAGGGISRGADGRRSVRSPGVTSLDGSYGGSN